MFITMQEKSGVNKKVNVYSILKNAIQFMELEPGSTISEADLAVKLGVSRTPIREALLRLADERLVDIYPQRGTYVSKIDLSLAKEMTYMRHVLETEICLKLCHEKADIMDLVDDKLTLMQLALKKKDTTEYLLQDDLFHRAIFAAGNHEAIWNVISNTRAHYIRILVLDMQLPNSLDKSLEDHHRIIDCIREGNEKDLISIMNVHHDYQEIANEAEIKSMHSSYFI